MLRKALFIGVGLVLLLVVATVGLRLWLRSDAIRATVERQATAALGMPVRIGGASATVYPRLGLDLRMVEVGAPARGHLDQISIATGLGLIFSHRVEEADVRISGGYLDAALLAALATLHAPAANARTAGQAPFTIVSIGSFRLRNVDLVAGVERIPVDLDASLEGDHLDVSSLTARIGNATFQIQGRMSSLATREGQFDVRADVLPIGALLATLQSLSSERVQKNEARAVQESPLHITAAVSAPVATMGSSRLESFKANLTATADGYVFDPLAFGIDDGRFEARVAINPLDRRATLDIRGSVAGVNVARLQDPGGPSDRRLTGRLGAQFTLRAAPEASLAELLDGARGTIALTIQDGQMPGIEVIRQTVIRFARRDLPPTASAATNAFSRLDASLALQGAPARVTSLSLKAADFDLTGDGTLSFLTTRVALDVHVTLSEALSQQAGRDLYRYAREGGRIVLPATIGGTLSEPAVSINVAEAAQRALKNKIEDETRSILDRLFKRGQRP